MRTDAELEKVMIEHADTVWRVCTSQCSEHADAEDAFQATFVKYATSDKAFNDSEHIKAWLIRVASNQCKDIFRVRKRTATPVESIDEDLLASGASQALWSEAPPGGEESAVMSALLELPPEYREVMLLIYCEGYTAVEVADILEKPVNTIYTHVSRAKKMMKEVLEDG